MTVDVAFQSRALELVADTRRYAVTLRAYHTASRAYLAESHHPRTTILGRFATFLMPSSGSDVDYLDYGDNDYDYGQENVESKLEKEREVRAAVASQLGRALTVRVLRA